MGARVVLPITASKGVTQVMSTVMVVGSDGRTHRIARSLRRSSGVNKVLVVPGNAGTAEEEKCENRPMKADDLDGISRLASTEKPDLVVVCPEIPLVRGIGDRLRGEGRRVFGLGRRAAMITEGSKEDCKRAMERWGVPTAKARLFTASSPTTDLTEHLRSCQLPIVLKWVYPAAGKGVRICSTVSEAIVVAGEMFASMPPFEGQRALLVEEFMEGFEFSVFCFTDGKTIRLLRWGRDYKRAYDDDRGFMTGGVGAQCPSEMFSTRPELEGQVRDIFERMIRGLHDEGIDQVQGCLYGGFMATPTGAKIVEFNCRPGDPETQVILGTMTADLFPLLDGAAVGDLASVPEPTWRNEHAVCIVICAPGYPEKAHVGEVVLGLSAAERLKGVEVLEAGTGIRESDRARVSVGGRIVNIIGYDEHRYVARERAMAGAALIASPGSWFRHDIALN